MSVCICYTYRGELRDVLQRELEDKIEEEQEYIDSNWRTLLALAAQSPTENKDCGGYVIPWADYVSQEVQKLRRELEEGYRTLYRAYDVREARTENPEEVVDSY